VAAALEAEKPSTPHAPDTALPGSATVRALPFYLKRDISCQQIGSSMCRWWRGWSLSGLCWAVWGIASSHMCVWSTGGAAWRVVQQAVAKLVRQGRAAPPPTHQRPGRQVRHRRTESLMESTSLLIAELPSADFFFLLGGSLSSIDQMHLISYGRDENRSELEARTNPIVALGAALRLARPGTGEPTPRRRRRRRDKGEATSDMSR
jgi:hypothetical protein